MNGYSIVPYNDSYKIQVIDVWERSVRATHDFLISSDIEYFKSIVVNIDFNAFTVYCLMKEDMVRGFIGVADKKIEMLFLSPEVTGKGLGKWLIEFAMNELYADEVDVNEQNHNAVGFYKRMGFVAYERTDKDSEGKDYPILKMRIQ